MATNIALKRARKAQRRKQVVAQKRRAEILEASRKYLGDAVSVSIPRPEADPVLSPMRRGPA